MAHQHERRLESFVLHETMQITNGRIAPRGISSRVTPAEVSAVIPARTRKFGYATLGWRPDVARRGAATHEHYDWTAFASAVDVQRSATNVDRVPNLLQHPAIAPRSGVFVRGRCQQRERYDGGDDLGNHASQPTNQLPSASLRHRRVAPVVEEAATFQRGWLAQPEGSFLGRRVSAP